MSFSFSHDHVGITVTPEELETTIGWYSDKLGFAVDQRFKSHGTTVVYLVAGDVKIELLTGASNRGARFGNSHVGIAVPDLDAALAELSDRGVRSAGAWEVAEIGQRIAFITDNLGNIIELAEPGTWPAARGEQVSPLPRQHGHPARRPRPGASRR